jgi:broad specificity phosphatase PhoE
MGELVLVRHGQTEWSRTGRHTSRTDVDLTDAGRAQAVALGPRLSQRAFARVLTSPRRRATETARLAGLTGAEPTDDLREWDYGAYEGRTTADIRLERRAWTLWDEGVPGGEDLAAVTARVDRVIDACADTAGDVALVAHAHVLRVLAARWLHLDGAAGRLFALDPASVSVLGHEREQRVVTSWNVAS